MSIEYVNKYYGLNLKQGMSVLALGEKGKVRSATHHVRVRLDSGELRNYHPADVVTATVDCCGCPQSRSNGECCGGVRVRDEN